MSNYKGPSEHKYKRRKINPILPLLHPDIVAGHMIFKSKLYPIITNSLFIQGTEIWHRFSIMHGETEIYCRWYHFEYPGQAQVSAETGEVIFTTPFDDWSESEDGGTAEIHLFMAPRYWGQNLMA